MELKSQRRFIHTDQISGINTDQISGINMELKSQRRFIHTSWKFSISHATNTVKFTLANGVGKLISNGKE